MSMPNESISWISGHSHKKVKQIRLFQDSKPETEKHALSNNPVPACPMSRTVTSCFPMVSVSAAVNPGRDLTKQNNIQNKQFLLRFLAKIDSGLKFIQAE